MKPTLADLNFWQSRHHPSWAVKLAKPVVPTSVHGCINARARVTGNGKFRATPHYELDAGNLISMLKSVRKREDVLPWLERVSVAPGTLVNPKRRAGYARKWAKRIRHGRE